MQGDRRLQSKRIFGTTAAEMHDAARNDKIGALSHSPNASR